MVEEIFNEAFQNFVRAERENIIANVSERNLCGRLAIYLEEAKNRYGLTEYFADTEYNRKQGGQVKTIMDDNLKVIVVNCDLILHSRGKLIKRDNLIAIEMKKKGRPKEEKEKDRERLRAMTRASYDGVWSADGKTQPEHVCGYELGIFIEVDLQARTYTIERFGKGDFISENSGAL